MTTTNYLDLYSLFVNKVAGGDVLIFLGFSFLIIAFLAAKFRFPNQVTLMMFGLFLLLISITFQSVLPLMLYVIGSIIAWSVSKVFKDN